jgi:hypothetical protein
MSSPTPLSAWHLPSLLVPVHQYKKSSIPYPKQRSHFLAIVAYVYRNRFAIASQVQRRFSQILKSDRTARRHLAELEELGYLAVVPTRGTSPLWPKTYFCTPRGATHLRRSLEAQGRPGNVIRVDRARPEGYSADHVLHELLTTELLLNVWQAMQVESGFQLLQTERRSIPAQPGFIFETRGRATRLEPDAWFAYRHEGKGMMCCFCELDAGTMTKDQLKAKFWRYEMWATSLRGREFLIDLYRRHGAKSPHPAFRILVVACDREQNHDHRRLVMLRDAAQPFPTVDSRLSVAAASDLTQPSDLRALFDA